MDLSELWCQEYLGLPWSFVHVLCFSFVSTSYLSGNREVRCRFDDQRRMLAAMLVLPRNFLLGDGMRVPIQILRGEGRVC